MLEVFGSLVQNQELLSQKTSVIVISEVVSVARSHALEVYEIAPLISTLDSFDLNTTSNFDLFALSIDQFVHLNVKLITNRLHHFMELRLCLYSLLLIHSSVLSETCQVAVVENSRNNALSDDSTALVIHNGSGEETETIDLENLQRLQAHHIVVGLGPAGIVLLRRKILEAVDHVQSVTEEYVVVDINLLEFVLIRVQRLNVAVDDCDCSSRSSVQEVDVDFLDSSISLSALGHGL